MSAATEQASNGSAASADPDALYVEFKTRTAALTPGAIGGTDALIAEIAASSLPDTTFKALADDIAKATGLDKDAICKRITKGRGAYEGAAAAGSAMIGGILSCATDPEPSANPEPLAKLLDMIVRVIVARVYCSTGAAYAVALWCVATWGVFPPSNPAGGPDLFPRLHFFSPMKRCGKSTFLEVVQHTVRRPLPATDVSEAAMFRTIDRWRPTLLIDEADRLFSKNRDLVGLANSGYTRSGQVIRTVEVQRGGLRTFDPVSFSTYAATALAGIGPLPSTTEDRSIRVALQRQPQGQTRPRIGLGKLLKLREIIGPHLMAHADAIGAAMARGVPESTIPRALNDRDADNWRPLLGLATLAGGDWPARAQHAAVELCGENADGDRGNEWSLRQIIEGVTAFRASAVEEYLEWRRGGRKSTRPLPGQRVPQRTSPCRFAPSDDLAAWLMAKDDSGFGDMRDGGSVKLRVARILRAFKVQPTQRRIGGQPIRGYDVAAIRAVWRRYRP